MSTIRKILAVCLVIFLSACPSPEAKVTPDFSVLLSSSSLSLETLGQNAAVTLNVTRNNSFTDSLNFTIERGSLPSGISISPIASDSNSASFRINYSNQVSAGDYTATFRVSAAGVSRTATLNITVKAAVTPDFSVGLSSSTLTFDTLAQNAAVTLNVTRNNSFSDALNFSFVRGSLPSGISITQLGVTPNSATFRVKYDSKVAAGDYSVTFEASAAGVKRTATLNITVKGGTHSNSSFDITLEFASSVPDNQKALFQQAAAKWSEVITGDLPDTPSNTAIPANACGSGIQHPAVNGAIDDVHIFVDVRDIDGAGGTLAQAGPCFLRQDGTFLPIYGIMVFDVADATGELLPTTILHEMAHVLGVGSLWPFKNLVNYQISSCPTQPEFSGTHTVAEWQRLGQSGNVPVEGDGGRGTACGHWDEGVLDNELMTGFIEGIGTTNPLSRVTVASLKDFGYEVNLASAEAYSVPSCAPNCTRGGHASSREAVAQAQGLAIAQHEIILQPVGVMESDGVVRTLTAKALREMMQQR